MQAALMVDAGAVDGGAADARRNVGHTMMPNIAIQENNREAGGVKIIIMPRLRTVSIDGPTLNSTKAQAQLRD